MLSGGRGTRLFIPAMNSSVSSAGTSQRKASSFSAWSPLLICIEGPMTMRSCSPSASPATTP